MTNAILLTADPDFDALAETSLSITQDVTDSLDEVGRDDRQLVLHTVIHNLLESADHETRILIRSELCKQ